MKKVSRRRFLVSTGVGGGVVLGAMYFGGCGIVKRKIAGYANTAESPYLGNTKTPLIWFEVMPNNQIIFSSSKVEMGQGVFTGLAQIAADELDVEMGQMEVRHAPSQTGNVDRFATGGSTSINSLWTPLRELAATMREMIKNHGAELMNVSVDKLSTNKGIVSGENQSMTYGDIASKVSEWKVPSTPSLRNIDQYKHIGKPIVRVDLEDKVKGAHIFGMDAVMPDMLFGSVVRSERVGAKYVDADISEAEKMPGVVKIVKEPDFVGVIATSYNAANNAKHKIKAQWDVDKVWQSSEIESMIEVGKGKPVVIQKNGQPNRFLGEQDEFISSEYRSPIGAHAQLEPNGAVAHVKDGKATIMMSTQVIKLTAGEVADRLGIKEKNVNIIPTFLGGGFGRRLHTPNAMEAAVMSRAVGRPVKCFFTRQEEFQNDYFRPPTHHILKAKLSAEGIIEALEHNVSSGDVMYGSPLVPNFAQPLIGSDIGAWRGGMVQYGAIPNYQAISWRVKLPFATSWWRSLGLLANTFAIESFMDELAILANANPADFRLRHIQKDKAGDRLKKVIEAAVEKSGYRDELLSNGRAMGIAASTDVNTPVCHVAEVSVENEQIKVHKVTCAIDVGLAINPDQIRAQCEGSIVMGISAAMYEEMKVVDSVLRPTIYGPYKMALMKDAPKEIEVVILENDEEPGGVGEPPLGPIGAAIANAAFRITGKRNRTMPLQT
ncbi:xanthine dehydrogenase family protein molybdopterin-binding subunit [Portibacter marinus]|uniref:xanthine dehydrogenase family protein molybdopterin-binding subunit n=1 Tax=Portibacter marinus TaxID=2898660 RepID=UPI001F2A00ED|nr:molybdopterin cofactor-binding domain-containing protein [Portibacter marinus]